MVFSHTDYRFWAQKNHQWNSTILRIRCRQFKYLIEHPCFIGETKVSKYLDQCLKRIQQTFSNTTLEIYNVCFSYEYVVVLLQNSQWLYAFPVIKKKKRSYYRLLPPQRGRFLKMLTPSSWITINVNRSEATIYECKRPGGIHPVLTIKAQENFFLFS